MARLGAVLVVPYPGSLVAASVASAVGVARLMHRDAAARPQGLWALWPGVGGVAAAPATGAAGA